MTTRHVGKLTTQQLDWAVAFIRCMQATGGKPVLSRDLMAAAVRNGLASASTDWGLGGPTIERERICYSYEAGVFWAWLASDPEGSRNPRAHGPTLLIAAMRCFVQVYCGDTVDIPEDV